MAIRCWWWNLCHPGIHRAGRRPGSLDLAVTTEESAYLRHSFVMRKGQLLPVYFYSAPPRRGRQPKHLSGVSRFHLCPLRPLAGGLCLGPFGCREPSSTWSGCTAPPWRELRGRPRSSGSTKTVTAFSRMSLLACGHCAGFRPTEDRRRRCRSDHERQGARRAAGTRPHRLRAERALQHPESLCQHHREHVHRHCRGQPRRQRWRISSVGVSVLGRQVIGESPPPA